MNKKYFLGMFAAAGMLLATSCSNDDLIEQGSGDMATVSFNITTEGAPMSRAISDGTKADKLVWRVYDKDGNVIAGQNNNVETNFTSGQTVNVRLAKGQTYKVAFWAQDADCNAYKTDDLRAVTVDYTTVNANNDETRDAFFEVKQITVSGNKTEKVILNRPFAQINVGVTDEDWNAAVASGVTVATSSVKIENAATTIDLINGKVSGEENVTYIAAIIPGGNNPLTGEKLRNVAGIDYNYLSMCYVLPNNDPAENVTTVKAEFTFSAEGKGDIVLKDGLDNLNIQRNYRTNIVGTILTGKAEFNVVIDAKFDNEPGYIKYVGTEEMVKILQSSNNVTLTADYVVTGNWTPIQISGQYTLDGNGHTISGLNATTENHFAGLFADVNGDVTIKNLTIDGAKWTAPKDDVATSDCLGAALMGYVEGGNIAFENVTIVNSNLEGKYIGGLVGFADGFAEFSIKNCTVKNTTFNGEGSTGALVGYTYSSVTANGVNIEDNTINGNRSASALVGSVAEGGWGTKKVEVSNATFNNNQFNVSAPAKPNIKSDEFGYVWTRCEYSVNGVSYVTAAQLKAVLTAGTEVTLDKDYVVTDAWTPVDGINVLDGVGHSISGLTASLLADNCGGGVTVKDLTIKDSQIAAGGNASGAIIAYVNQQTGLTLEKCHLVNSTVNCNSGLQAGGLAGLVTNQEMTIKNCSVKNSTVNGGSSAAGIVGLATTSSSSMKIENCNVANSTITSADNGDWRVGGIVGTVNGTGKLTVSGCTVDAATTFTQNAGADEKGRKYDKTNHIYGRATAPNLIEVN